MVQVAILPVSSQANAEYTPPAVVQCVVAFVSSEEYSQHSLESTYDDNIIAVQLPEPKPPPLLALPPPQPTITISDKDIKTVKILRMVTTPEPII